MKATVYIYASWDKWEKKFTYRALPWETSDQVLIEKREIEFETLEDAELRRQMHAVLLQKRKDVLADAYAEAAEIEAIANEMLAIENKMEPVVQQPAKEIVDDIPF